MVSDNLVEDMGALSERVDENYDLTSFESLSQRSWTEESQMYESTVVAIKNCISDSDSKIVVHNSHAFHRFRADISIAKTSYLDNLPYGLLYFVELKLPSARNLFSPENCGQILNYVYNARRKQPYRNSFVAILSNLQTAFLFKVESTSLSRSPIGRLPLWILPKLREYTLR